MYINGVDTVTLKAPFNIKSFFKSIITEDIGNKYHIIQNGPVTVMVDDNKKKVAMVRCSEKDKQNSYRGIIFVLARFILTSNEWNKLIRPIDKPNVQFAVAEALVRYSLGDSNFKSLIAYYKETMTK